MTPFNLLKSAWLRLIFLVSSNETKKLYGKDWVVHLYSVVVIPR